MNATLYPVCAIVAWSIVLVRLRPRPRRRAAAEHALTATFLFFALTFSVGSSVLWQYVNGLFGLEQLGTLVSQSCVIGFSGSTLVLLLFWALPPERARRSATVCVTSVCLTVAVMVTLFLRTARAHQHDHAFASWYAGSVEYDVYLGVFLVVFAVTLVAVAAMCRRYAHLAEERWLRAGLRTTAAGAGIAMVYALGRAVDIVAAYLALDLYSWEDVAEAGAGLGALTIMAGLTMPSWGPCLAGPRSWPAQFLAYHRLRPLWEAVYRENPAIALDPPTGCLHSLRQLAVAPDYLPGRRAIEIRDGMLAVRCYLDADTGRRTDAVARGQGGTNADVAAAIEAGRLQAALAAKAAGGEPVADMAGEAPESAACRPIDAADEIEWLTRVARAFQNTTVTPVSHLTSQQPVERLHDTTR